jgi:hypothetical protein
MIADLYRDDDAAGWDDVVAQSPGATLFHHRAFLAYHGTRFRDAERWLVFRDGRDLRGVLPLAIHEVDGQRVATSPYGASVGGPVFREVLRHHDATEALTALRAQLDALEVDVMRVTLPPTAWRRWPDDTMGLALLNAGFRTVERDVHSLVPLTPDAQRPRNQRVQRNVKRAQGAGVRIERGAALAPFLQVLDATFRKHGTAPTHSADELARLLELCPQHVRLHVAWVGDVPAAGIAEFVVAPRVVQSFYLAHDPALQDAQSLSMLLDDAVRHAQADGFAWYDLGTSSVGGVARASIFEFKEGFGAVGQFRERLEWRHVWDVTPHA